MTYRELLVLNLYVTLIESILKKVEDSEFKEEIHHGLVNVKTFLRECKSR